jgi:hypothetical protein
MILQSSLKKDAVTVFEFLKYIFPEAIINSASQHCLSLNFQLN